MPVDRGVEVYPATPERWEDLERLFGPPGGVRRVLVHVVEAGAVGIRTLQAGKIQGDERRVSRYYVWQIKRERRVDMSSHLVYLIIGVVCLIAGVWRLARRGNAVALIVGVLWFVTVLLQFYLPGVYKFKPIDRIPNAGNLIHYVAVPVFIIILLFSVRERS